MGNACTTATTEQPRTIKHIKNINEKTDDDDQIQAISHIAISNLETIKTMFEAGIIGPSSMISDKILVVGVQIGDSKKMVEALRRVNITLGYDIFRKEVKPGNVASSVKAECNNSSLLHICAMSVVVYHYMMMYEDNINNPLRSNVNKVLKDMNKMVEFLIKMGVNPTRQDGYGNTVLHYLALTDNTNLITVLYKAGAVCFTRNNQDDMPHNVALKIKNKTTADYINMLAKSEAMQLLCMIPADKTGNKKVIQVGSYDAKQDKKKQAPKAGYDGSICIICLDKKRDHIFLPCSHLATCSTCSNQLDRCPLCKKPILLCRQVFIS